MPGGRRPVIGLAGGIGAGKSTVARMLADLGCVVADSDVLARQALGDPAIRDALLRWWGPQVLSGSGQIDRAAVARIVFARPPERRRLESVVHPWVESRRRALFQRAPRDAPALVIDAPLLFEAGVDRACDAVVFVEADRDTRVGRLAESRGWDEQELSKREDLQRPLDEKQARADYVISNTGDLDALTEQVRRTLSEIVQPHRS